MNKFLLITLLFLINCSGPESNSRDFISKDQMTIILKERQLIVSTFNTFQYDGKLDESVVDSLLSSVYLEMGYSENQFQTSWNFYMNDSKGELIEIYDSILHELEYDKEITR
ncbi:MAG: DUF4296 domain-containing protein [Flavobacteriales bacterium]